MLAHRPNSLFFVGVAGAAGVGKDSFARALAATVPHASVIPFALPIRVLAASVSGLVPPNRATLLALGATARSVRPDIWIAWHRTMVEAERLKDANEPSIPERKPWSLVNYRCIIVPDVRFYNEAHYLRTHAPHCLLVGLRHPTPEKNEEHDVPGILRTCDFVWENRYVEPFNPMHHFRPVLHDVVMRLCSIVHDHKVSHAR